MTVDELALGGVVKTQNSSCCSKVGLLHQLREFEGYREECRGAR